MVTCLDYRRYPGENYDDQFPYNVLLIKLDEQIVTKMLGP